MQKYILTVSCAAVICGLCDILLPKSYRKYIGILTGAILLSTLLSPFGISKSLELPELDVGGIQIRDYDVNALIEEQLCERLCSDIEARLWEEFSIKARARVKTDCENGEIRGVSEISLSCAESSAVRERLCEVYAPKSVIFEGG